MADKPRDGNGRRYFALVMWFFLPVGWIGLGVWLVIAGLGIHSRTDMVAGWPQTTGWVARVHYSFPSYAKEPTYAPVIAFRAAGHLVTFTAPGDSDRPTVGAPARVAYNPRDPTDAHDLSIGSRWAGVFSLGAGIVVSGVALLAFFYRVARHRNFWQPTASAAMTSSTVTAGSAPGEPLASHGQVRHARPTPVRHRLVSVLLGVAWTAVTLAGFTVGFGVTYDTEPAQPGLPIAQDPAPGPLLAGIGGLVLAFMAGAQISLLRDRRSHPSARYKVLHGSRYLTIGQSLRHNLWPVLIGACFIGAGLWLAHHGG
jgi:hypothetical protein